MRSSISKRVDILRAFRNNSQEQDTGLWLVRVPHGDIAEVSIEGDDEPVLADRALDVAEIWLPWPCFGSRIPIVPGGAQAVTKVVRERAVEQARMDLPRANVVRRELPYELQRWFDLVQQGVRSRVSHSETSESNSAKPS